MTNDINQLLSEAKKNEDHLTINGLPTSLDALKVQLESVKPGETIRYEGNGRFKRILRG